MSPESGRAARRLASLKVWMAPVVVVAVVAAAAALTTVVSAAGSSPNLPRRTPSQLLVDIQKHAATSLSGRVVETANLGLPALPGSDSGASLAWQGFLTGSHVVRLWIDGPDKQRAALIGKLSEADVVHSGRDVWTYTSDTNSVSHSVLRSSSERTAQSQTEKYSPTQAAAQLLKAIDPSTSVTVESNRRVAGRAVYVLALVPRDANSTVRKATIAVDAQHYVPLQVAIYGSGSQPAFRTGFSSVSFTRPAASVFAFRPPAGASIVKDPFGLSGPGGHGDRLGAPSAPSGSAARAKTTSPAPRVIGTAWTTVLELHGGSGPASSIGLGNATLHDLTTRVGTDGARLLHTALVNAVFLPDGRTFVGAVKPAALEHIAATTPR
jgi:outer membrane lipoprotein-sorting protein